jgi:ligand-binding SRPBCC domain-containing protein
MVAFGCLALIVIVCQCGMLTLVLVCLGVRAGCNWAESSQQAAGLRFCDTCWRAPFAFVRCWGRCACIP